MSKSLKQNVLAIAKKNEAERLQRTKEKILGLVQREYDKLLEKGEYIVHQVILPEYDVDCIDKTGSIVKQAILELGFDTKKINHYDYTDRVKDYAFSVPAWVKGQKKTPAQLQRCKFETECKKRIRAEELERKRIKQEHRDHARLACEEVLERLKRGDIISTDRVGDQYIIYVKADNHGSSYRDSSFREEVKRIMKKHRFEEISMNDDGSWWIFVS